MYENRFSTSKIKVFDQCKLQYKLKYVDKIKIEQPDTPDLVFGRMIHKVAEIYDPEKDNKEEIVKIVKEFPELPKEYKALIPQTYKNLLHSFFDKYGKYPAKTETEYNFQDDEVWIYGIVDRLIEQEDAYIAVDYKTSKTRGLDRHIFQLKFYTVLLSKNHDISPDKIRLMIYYPRIDEYDRTQFSNSEISLFEKELRRKIRKIQDNKKWNATQGFHCRWCPFFKTEYCPETNEEKHQSFQLYN